MVRGYLGDHKVFNLHLMHIHGILKVYKCSKANLTSFRASKNIRQCIVLERLLVMVLIKSYGYFNKV